MDESGLRRAIEQTAKSLGKSLKELRVLDAGCGTGNYLDAISDLPCQFTGFDGSSGMINWVAPGFSCVFTTLSTPSDRLSGGQIQYKLRVWDVY